jgi:hypothetical protein
VDIRKLPLKVLRVIFTKESLPRFSDHSKKEICDILVDLKINGKKIVFKKQSAGGKASSQRKISIQSSGRKATAVRDKRTPGQEHQDGAAGGDSFPKSPQAAIPIRLQVARPKVLQAPPKLFPAPRPTILQASKPAGELMVLLQAKIERLRKSQKCAYDVGLMDDVKEYNTTIKGVEKEIDDLEDAKIDQLRRDAAAAVNH